MTITSIGGFELGYGTSKWLWDADRVDAAEHAARADNAEAFAMLCRTNAYAIYMANEEARLAADWEAARQATAARTKREAAQLNEDRIQQLRLSGVHEHTLESVLWPA